MAYISVQLSLGILFTVILHTEGHLKIRPFTFPSSSTLGEKITVTCASRASGRESVSYKWLRNGNVLLGDNIKLNSYEGMSLLVLDPLTERDEGNYTCVASSSSGTDSYTTYLNVLAPPRWVNKPQSHLEIREGSYMDVPCSGYGKPQPKSSWKKLKESVKEELYENHRMSFTKNGSLIITKTERKDGGAYECEINNLVGAPLSQQVHLQIIVPARFEDKFSVLNVKKGESAALKCDAQGDKPVTISWAKDKKLLDFNKLSGVEKFDQDTEEGLMSELLIRSADRTDGALYTCLSKNEYGSDERNIKLLVVEVPAPPLDLRVQDVWSKSVSIRWTAPYTGNSPISKYIVQYWRDRDGSAHRLHEETVPSAQTTAILKGLRPGTMYAIALIAENEIGQGDPSDVLKVTTDEEEPTGPPTDVKVESRGSGAILITWKAPPKEYWNGELKGYFVGYKAADSPSKSYSFKTVDTWSNDTYEYLLTNLLKSTRYSIVVKGYNKAGTGPPSQELTARTLDGEVPLPPPIALASSSDSTISVRWGESPTRMIQVSGFTLHYRKDASGEWYQIPIISPSLNRFTVSGLESGSTYRVYLRATNQYGSGDPSEIITVKTSNSGYIDGLPFYLDLAIVIPAAACLLAFIVIISVIGVFIHKIRARRNLEKAIHGSKHYGYQGTAKRYIDMDKRQLDPGTPGSAIASYATLPTDHSNHRQELKTFDSQSVTDRPLPHQPKTTSLPKKNPRLYDTAE